MIKPIRVVKGLSDRAGVAIILKNVDRKRFILFIRRSKDIHDPWAGHVAFPGGHAEESDKDILDTIYREVREETGIDLKRYGKLLFKLPLSRPRNMPNLKVYPYVFSLNKSIEPKCGVEVEEYYWIPINNLEKSKVKVNYRGVEKVVDAYIGRIDDKKIIIWGMTKRILDNLIKRIGKEFFIN